MATRMEHKMPVELAKVRHNWERWRQQQPCQRAMLPQSFWAEAVQLAGKYGVSRTARALRLHSGRLQRLVAAGTPVAPAVAPAEAPPEFLEWFAPAAVRGTDCVLELEARRGGKLRLEIKGVQPAELATLVRALIAE